MPLFYCPASGKNMGNKTLLERVMDLEDRVKSLEAYTHDLTPKIVVYNKIIQKKQSYDQRLKKARAALKKKNERNIRRTNTEV